MIAYYLISSLIGQTTIGVGENMDYWESKKPKYRQPERNANCRVCENVIKRNEDWMVSWYSSCNRGMYIHICPSCIESLYALLPKEDVVESDETKEVRDIDTTGTLCKHCKEGKMFEGSIYDDWDGKLTCNKCGVREKRWVVDE